MKRLLMLFVFCRIMFADKHSIKFFFTGSTGLTFFSEFEILVTVDDIPVASCDGANKTVKLYYDWVKRFLNDDPALHSFYQNQCFHVQAEDFKNGLTILKHIFKQPEGIHVLQRMYSCEKDDETQKVNAVCMYGYDGEDLMALDLEAETWITPNSQANPNKTLLGSDKANILLDKNILTKDCPDWMERLLNGGKNILLRTKNPSLSLLQKTFFSPVSCHATGFYPKRALMFWTKDGEEIHEDVEHGEILPNNDETFQTKVNLNVSSIRPKDWRRYNCVFQLLGKEEETIQLDKAKITSNREKPSNTISPMTAAVIGSVLVSIAAAAGYVVYKKNRNKNLLVPSSCKNTSNTSQDQLRVEPHPIYPKEPRADIEMAVPTREGEMGASGAQPPMGPNPKGQNTEATVLRYRGATAASPWTPPVAGQAQGGPR
ncbi:major histocompatibility complex class I-related gene protein-like [Cyprinodon tularosa]|uniref:major histocompatibility complex class I-related gene protein-like n=1 Tax=Cyprinodon tularosa TaxID=77115 RepID=UPI0018E21B10|nr:major histocompatibility complex class I-related gene protein-like [Cyprinodon tularosa]